MQNFRGRNGKLTGKQNPAQQQRNVLKYKLRKREKERQRFPSVAIPCIEDVSFFLGKRFDSFLKLFSSVCGKNRPEEHGSVAAKRRRFKWQNERSSLVITECLASNRCVCLLGQVIGMEATVDNKRRDLRKTKVSKKHWKLKLGFLKQRPIWKKTKQNKKNSTHKPPRK